METVSIVYDEREATPGKMQAPTTVSSVLNSAKFIAAHAQHVKISQSGVTKAARKVGQTGTLKEVDVYSLLSYSIPSFFLNFYSCFVLWVVRGWEVGV